MATETKATVFKQYTLKAQELGKAAIIAGIGAATTLLYVSLSAGHMPTLEEFKAAGGVFMVTALGVIVRDFVKPTITVIKGQDAPVASINSAGTVITTDAKKP